MLGITRMKKSPYEWSRHCAPTKLFQQEETSVGAPKHSRVNVKAKTILIVDDRPANRQLLLGMLAHHGHRMLEADSAVKGLKMVRKEKPDLIIADILMPKMHGYEFVRRLRSDPNIAHTAVVFFTAGYIEEESRKLARACGVHHVIVKPVNPEEVIQIVNKALAARRRASASLSAHKLARKHLRLVTDRLAGKVCELEELNGRLQTEGVERERMVTESLLAHAEARHARDEAERANCAKDDFLAILSHELRTPLTPVLMCATALEQEESIEPELRAQLSMIRRNVQLEARLIDDLLDLTKIARGTLQLVGAGPIDVHSLLTHTREIVENDASQKSVQLDFDLMASEHHVRGDATRLHQVFWNLIKNAIKFSVPGGRITVRTFNPLPGEFVLTVEDTGAGITQQTLPDIFRAFVQGESREARVAGGLGLGLAISKAIVEAHGGTIRAESAGPGLGAVFTIQLAAVLPFSTAVVTESESRFRTAPPRLRLLVIEDHEPTMMVLVRLLRHYGHEVFTAENVERALAVAAAHTFDLVISDLGLPDGNGIDLMRKLAKDYGLRGIALSGYGMPEDRAKTKQAGFLAHLVKPINFDQLQSALQLFAPATRANAASEVLGQSCFGG
jgi:signal transduction histidine kinase